MFRLSNGRDHSIMEIVWTVSLHYVDIVVDFPGIIIGMINCIGIGRLESSMSFLFTGEAIYRAVRNPIFGHLTFATLLTVLGRMLLNKSNFPMKKLRMRFSAMKTMVNIRGSDIIWSDLGHYMVLEDLSGASLMWFLNSFKWRSR
jgi:hypothetical protein